MLKTFSIITEAIARNHNTLFQQGKRLVTKWIQSLTELLLYCPVILIIYPIVLQSSDIWLWLCILPFYSFMGILLEYILSLKSKSAVFFCGLILATAFPLIVIGISPASFIVCTAAFYSFYRGTRVVRLPWNTFLPAYTLWIGLGGYLVASIILLRYFESPPTTLLSVCGILYVLFFLLKISHLQLRASTFAHINGSGVPLSLMKKNLWFVSVIFIAIVFVSQIVWLKQLFLKVFSLIASFLMFLTSLLPKNEVNLRPTHTAPPPLPSSDGSSFLIFKVIFFIVVLSILLFVLIHTLILLYKLTKSLFKRGQSPETPPYIDEQENLLNMKNIGTRSAHFLKNCFSKVFQKEPKWADLKTSTEKIRYLYRHLVLYYIAKGYPFKNTRTPSETGKDLEAYADPYSDDVRHLVNLYNTARYSHHPIPPSSVKEIKKHPWIKKQ